MNISDLFASPDHFLFAFDNDQAVFLEMDRDAYHRSIFCDRRISPANPQMIKVDTAQLVAYNDRQVAKGPGVASIFHVAHCGSTLLARALDRPADTLVIREPMPLRQLGVEAASSALSGQASQAWSGRLRLANTLMGRRYNPAGPVIVKANVPVNFIIPELMTLNPTAPTVFLYFPLEHYLMAILRTPNHRRWVESVTSETRLGVEQELAGQSDATPVQLAAALWLAQVRIYAQALERYPHARSLNAEDLFNTPRPVLEAAFGYFGVPASSHDIDTILAGELFARYSKNPQVAFDNQARLERRTALRSEIAEDLKAARTWIEARLALKPLPQRLPHPLTGESPDLLMQA
jgi:hypothetical protein